MFLAFLMFSAHTILLECLDVFSAFDASAFLMFQHFSMFSMLLMLLILQHFWHCWCSWHVCRTKPLEVHLPTPVQYFLIWHFYHQNSCGGLSFLLERRGPVDVFDVVDDSDDTELDRRLFFVKRRKSEVIFWSLIRSTVRFMMMVLPTCKKLQVFI